jgi:DNA invertase Pin-like site-specific DNA recombinase
MDILIEVDEMLKEKIYQKYKKEFYAKYLGELISAKKQELKAKGKWLGGIIPFGWKLKDDKMIKDVKQQKIIKYMKSLQKDGFSLRKISKKIELKYNLKYSHVAVNNIMLRKKVRL